MADLDLKLYDSVQDFDHAVNEMKHEVNNIKLDINFMSMIQKLEKKEEEIYKALGGTVENGKKAMYQLADVFYINNKERNDVIKIANELFMPIYIEEENGKSNYYELRSESKKLGINKNNSSKNMKQDAEEYFKKFCEYWNKSVSQYDNCLETIKNNMYKPGFITDNTITTIITSLSIIAKTLQEVVDGKVTLNNLPEKFKEEKSRMAGIFGNFIGDITEGAELAYTNMKIQEINDFLIKNGNKLGLYFEHGDTIGNGDSQIHKQITGYEKEAKADGVFTLQGVLHSQKAITLPMTLKYTSRNEIKTHSGSLSSIADIIEKETSRDGSKYAAMFRKLSMNIAYWIHVSNKESSEPILILKKILNSFAFSFIYGIGENDQPYGNALFFAGFFKDVNNEKNTYNNYFTPVSKILRQVYYYILDSKQKDNFALDWGGFIKLDNFLFDNLGNGEYSIRLASDKELDKRVRKRYTKTGNFNDKILYYDRKTGKETLSQNFRNQRIAAEKERIWLKGMVNDNGAKFFTEISAKIKTQPMTYRRGIITGENINDTNIELYSIFNIKQKGGIIL